MDLQDLRVQLESLAHPDHKDNLEYLANLDRKENPAYLATLDPKEMKACQEFRAVLERRVVWVTRGNQDPRDSRV